MSAPGRDPSGGRSRWLPLLALAAASFLVSLALLEVGLRIVAPRDSSWLAIYRRHPVLPFHALLPNERVVVDTGETRWQVVTDGEGFRVGDREPAAADAGCTALWLGDSFAFGHGVDYEDSFVGLVGAASPGVRQIDTGVPGYGPVQYRQILEYRLDTVAKKPDYVYVVVYVGNDFHDTIWSKDVPVHEGVLGHRGDLKSFLKTHLHLYRMLSAAYHRIAPPDDPYAQVREELADPAAWQGDFLSRARDVFTQELARIQSLGREHAIVVRFVVLPTEDAVRAMRAGGGYAAESGPLLPVAKARAILEGIGADFFDVTPTLAASSEKDLYFRFDGHFTRAGNRIVARGIEDAWPLVCPVDRPGPASAPATAKPATPRAQAGAASRRSGAHG